MTWRWLICSDADLSFRPKATIVILVLIAMTANAAASQISGKVILRDSHVADVAKRGDYSGVVISLTPLNEQPDPPPRHVTMLQKNKTFQPHILAISVGSTVDFPNADPIFHNAFSSYSGQIFDIGLYAPGTSRSIRFTRPGVVRVFCNIHPAMSAVIVVLDTPYFEATGRDGTFTITAPPGDYQLNVYHERATEATLREVSKRMTVTSAAIQLPAIEISESGYLAIPHKNKYGHAYPPGSGDDLLYPGARQ